MTSALKQEEEIIVAATTDAAASRAIGRIATAKAISVRMGTTSNATGSGLLFPVNSFRGKMVNELETRFLATYQYFLTNGRAAASNNTNGWDLEYLGANLEIGS